MHRLRYNRQNLIDDLTAGITTALVTIPDGMASAILAGVNPVNGLYALMVGTPLAALTMSSQFMYVANTGALAVAVGDALVGFGGEQQAWDAARAWLEAGATVQGPEAAVAAEGSGQESGPASVEDNGGG